MDKRWYDFLVEFHATRDYYACHDFLEEWWFELKNPKDHILVAYIQVAVGMYQWRRGNMTAANIMFEKSLEKFQHNTDLIGQFGMDEMSLIRVVERVLQSVKNNETFYDINLPIIDFEMEDYMNQLCEERDLILYKESDTTNDHLVNKHLFKHKK
jgi:predicted metal-dependent hydrolase